MTTILSSLVLVSRRLDRAIEKFLNEPNRESVTILWGSPSATGYRVSGMDITYVDEHPRFNFIMENGRPMIRVLIMRCAATDVQARDRINLRWHGVIQAHAVRALPDQRAVDEYSNAVADRLQPGNVCVGTWRGVLFTIGTNRDYIPVDHNTGEPGFMTRIPVIGSAAHRRAERMTDLERQIIDAIQNADPNDVFTVDSLTGVTDQPTEPATGMFGRLPMWGNDTYGELPAPVETPPIVDVGDLPHQQVEELANGVSWDDIFGRGRPRQQQPAAPSFGQSVNANNDNRRRYGGLIGRRQAEAAVARANTPDPGIRSINGNLVDANGNVTLQPPPQPLWAIDWNAVGYWEAPGTDGQQRVRWTYEQMEPKHIWDTICWLVKNCLGLYKQYARQHSDRSPALESKVWLSRQPAFRAIVQHAIQRGITFPPDIFRYLRDYVVGRNNNDVQQSVPWNDPGLANQSAELAEFLNEPAVLPRQVDPLEEFGKEFRDIDL